MIYSKFIKDLGDKTGIPLRTISAEWKVAERQLNFDRMMEPQKYERLKKGDGSFFEEVGRRIEKTLITPEVATPEEKEVVPGEEPITPAEDIPVEELPLDTLPEESDIEEFLLPEKEEKKLEHKEETQPEPKEVI
jgi:hypothetical protein